MGPVRAVGFDLGETLLTYADAPLDWSSLYRSALVRVGTALEIPLSDTQLTASEKVLASYNTRLAPRIQEVDAQQIFSQMMASWPVNALIERRRAIEVFFGFFQQSLRAYEDTLPTLQMLRSRGIAVGVLTDVPYGMPREFVQRDLDVTLVGPMIDIVLTSVDVGFRKPSPEGLHRLALALGVSATEMIYVGNEPKDITAANAAGIRSVLIDRQKSGAALGQRFTINSLNAISELLGSAIPEE